jgi:hypothetical protein
MVRHVRRDAKRDENEPEIVDALERCGVHVWRHLPCDLLTYRQVCCPVCRGNNWLPLEVKMPHAKARADQPDQRAFLALTGTPIVRSAEDAIEALALFKRPRTKP